MAGSPCPVEVMRKVMTLMHMSDVGIAYGMTETSPVGFQTALDDPIERRVGTIGQVQTHLEVKIVDPETGEMVPRGMPGELCTRGYSIMLGYARADNRREYQRELRECRRELARARAQQNRWNRGYDGYGYNNSYG
jgi:acyl-CoA synthetase (AMP-forming)/AMP-acid ligase II